MVLSRKKESVSGRGREIGTCAQALIILLCAATLSWAEETASSPNAWTALKAKIEEREKSAKSFQVGLEWASARKTPIPGASDTVNRSMVQMKGDREIRIETEGERLSPIDKKPYLASTIHVTNVGVHKNFSPKLGNLYPGGWIRKEDDTAFYDHVAYKPLAVRFRMLEWMAADCPELSTDQVSVRTGSLNGKACVIASWTFQREPGPLICTSGDCKPPSPTVHAREVYLDPTREMVPLRITATIDGSRVVGARRMQWDLQYSVDDVGFVLSGWKSVATNADGDIIHAGTAKVFQWKVNPNLDDATFDIQFPVGTYVEDNVSGEKYILKENSRKRHVSAADWASGYEALLRTDPVSTQHR